MSAVLLFAAYTYLLYAPIQASKQQKQSLDENLICTAKNSQTYDSIFLIGAPGSTNWHWRNPIPLLPTAARVVLNRRKLRSGHGLFERPSWIARQPSCPGIVLAILLPKWWDRQKWEEENINVKWISGWYMTTINSHHCELIYDPSARNGL